MEARRSVLKLLLLVLLLIEYVLAQRAPYLTSTIERSALLDLRSSLGLRGVDWPIKSDPCRSWTGVRCQNGSVTEINVSGLNRTRAGRFNPRFRVDSLANLTRLVSFNASGFSLPGPIPDWFGSQLVSLRVLDLRSSSVNGSIPGSLGNLSRLRFLYLSGNDIVGGIPVELGELRELTVLDISRNSLTGSIPSSFGFLVNLTELRLASNYLSGNIPADLGFLLNLQYLNLSDNSFTASIPSQVGNLSRLIELDISKNLVSGSLPVELSGLRSLRKMLLGDNGLEGPVPKAFFDSFVQLVAVDLRLNKLDGALPSAFSSIPALRFVDLSGNNFTGSLPSFSFYIDADDVMFNLSNNFLYGNLNFSFSRFCWVDLSGNYVEGGNEMVYDIGSNITLDKNCLQAVPNQRNFADCHLFYEERGLAFESFGVPDSAELPLVELKSKRTKQLICILVGVLGGLVFIVLLVMVLVLVIRKCKKGGIHANAGPGDYQLPKDPLALSGLGQPFLYEQLHNATGGFSETNLIKHGHSGDLFWGILPGGIHVVVKKISLESLTSETYAMELEVFRKVSHARLVPLLGHCLERENEKLLVYKYMQNRDLASSFYMVTDTDADNLRSLDWITRLKIATGAAEVLSHLHHECSPPLMHRDVQASSILLDDKFEVRLGSLSEVRPQVGDNQNVLTRLLRKQQMSEAGPSGSSSMPCSYDVYCFGKVLLELVTGKLGISMSDDKSTKEWLDQTLPYINPFDKELVGKILDPSLMVDDDLLEEVWAMAIVAKSCLNPRPLRRPPMKYVLKALENPLKVMRVESFSSARSRTTSSRLSWGAAFFGSWRQSSSDSTVVPGNVSREVASGSRQYHGSGSIGHSSSRKRLSNEVFPEPLEIQDPERQRGY